ncbi:PREDICTED: probable E3 ubiquitin-protein ligase HERC4 [Calidris pugnax]|uniref:probable E3 ubiquitin-protein ligase HERC4 n=1 Tax=Calidris pugnax TaxID=198806 RepID=UPI00071DDFE8|nr:PREDICTED: probable E3 ubiquitin-protein ligase HERC4 [Calidris pugnax]
MRCSNHDATHTLILSAHGDLSEHWATASTNCPPIRLVKELGDQNIVQIACGDQHAMALSRGGELFTWGRNTHGQLGVETQTTFIPQPQLVKSIKGIPLAQIAAGGAHSAAVSLSGAVYSWGKNDFGQLGLGDTKDRSCPSYIGALEHWKTVFIACGADHTAALSKEGLVCTFGAGGAGQLGHNSTRNELRPRVVAELCGARVSQIACGRWHTLVYVPSLDKVYAFGAGEKGELGDRPNQLIPLPIDSPVNTGKSPQGNNTSQKVTEIIAGERQSIVLCKNENSYLNGIATLKDEDVDAWISNSSLQRRWKSIKKNIGLIFSSEACINGSFLEKRDKHFKTSKEFSGIDLSEVQRFYKKICTKPKVFEEVQNVIKMLLLPSLSSSPISPENFRVYLILPFLLQGEDDNSFHCLRLLAEAIMKLRTKDLKTLECLWSNLETSFFEKLVVLYQKVSQKNLSEFITEVTHQQRNISALQPRETVTLQILQTLYQVNSRTGFRVQESKFYVAEVKGIILCCWVAAPGLSAIHKLTKYPCIFDMEAKTMIFSMERQVLSSPFNDALFALMFHEQSVLTVDRHRLLQDIWTYLNSAQTSHFRKILMVRFVGEEGVDEGGLSQELFSVAARSLCQPHSGAFRILDSGVAWFPTQVSSGDDIFFRIGTLCGMALYNGRMAPFPFPKALYKKLLGLEPTLEDFKELLPDEGWNLQRILDEESDQYLESLDMNFTKMEEDGSIVELKQNGANIPVTKDNRKEFVDLYVNYVLNESIQKPFGDFKKGFLRGCPAGSWKIFLPVQLQIILQGHTKYDWKLLQKNVIYIQYGMLDQTIKNFWTVFHKLPEEKKKKFLAFLTGSDRIPGYAQENFTFAIKDPGKENPDEFYPYANTCSRILFLPRYSSKKILKKKLLYAIEHNETFPLR